MSLDVFGIVFPYWIRAFAFTLIVEAPFFAIIGKWRTPGFKAPTLWRLLAAGAAGTCITHPLLWFVWPRIVHDYTLYIASGELLVAAIETFTFFALARPISLGRAAIASSVANGASYIGGLLFHWITG